MISTEERAKKAYYNFNQLTPMLSGFAEALAERPIEVRAGSGTKTEGKTIFIRPPLALADDRTHVRSLCDERDENLSMLCEACRAHDELMAYLFHELGHLCFNSFESGATDRFRKEMVDYLEDAREQGKLIVNMNRLGYNDLKQVLIIARSVNNFMPGLLNALEDVRVDTAMVGARPGVANMHEAMYLEHMINGFEGIQHSDLDLNMQLSIAMIGRAKGYEIDGSFDDFVMQTLDVPAINNLLASVGKQKRVGDVLVVAFKLLVECQRLGFFIHDDAHTYIKVDEEEGSDDSVDDSDADGEPSESSNSDPGEPGEGEGGQPGADDSGESDDSRVPGDSDKSDEDSPVHDEAEKDREEPATGSDLSDDGTDDDSSSQDSGTEPGGEGDGPEAGDSVQDKGEDDSSGDSDSSDSGSESPMGEGDSEPEGDRDADNSGSDSFEGDAESGDAEGGSMSPDASATGEPQDVGAGNPLDDSATDTGDASTEGQPSSSARPSPEDFGGDSSKMEQILGAITGHVNEHDLEMTKEEQQVMDRVVGSLENFDEVSRVITKVDEIDVDRISRHTYESVRRATPESILGPATLHMRRVFADNAFASRDRNRRSGRVSSRVLGRRAWSDDDRLFSKKTKPGKRDYAVIIGIDASGSTAGWGASMSTLELELQAARAQAELCHRMGIKFAVYAHSGTGSALTIVKVKEFHEPWNAKAQDRLARVNSFAANLDGHTIEWYRKKLDSVKATDKILMYYSDGAMPAENYREELRVLKREIKTFKSKGYTLMAVGAKTNDPMEHGLDTVRIDRMSDISKVVKHLGKRIEEM